MHSLRLKGFLFFFIFSATLSQSFAAETIVRDRTNEACLAQLKTLIGLSSSMLNVNGYAAQELKKFRRKILNNSQDPLRSFRDLDANSETASPRTIEQIAGRLFALEESLSSKDPEEKAFAVYLDGRDIEKINKYTATDFMAIGQASVGNLADVPHMALTLLFAWVGIGSTVQAFHGNYHQAAVALLTSGGIFTLLKLFKNVYQTAVLEPSEVLQVPEISEGWHYSGFSEKIGGYLVKPILDRKIPGTSTWNKDRYLDLLPIGVSQLTKATLLKKEDQNKVILGDILYWRENPNEPAKLIIVFRVTDKRPKDEKEKKVSFIEAWNALRGLKPAKVSAK